MTEYLDEFNSDYERAEYFQNLLISIATHIDADDLHYKHLRQYFLNNQNTRDLLPSWVRTNRNSAQFWEFIKYKFPDYASRRAFIWSEFSQLFEYLENRSSSPAESSINEILERFDSEGIHQVWSKALERKISDPEGAITIARTLLESTLKQILENKYIKYDSDKSDLPELYKKTAISLKLAPSQHTEEIFRQILGGCSSVVNGLGSLRNKLGDAHGKGKSTIKPSSRHAELAINLSGAMALFLIETFENQKESIEICYSCKGLFPVSKLTQIDGDRMLCSDCLDKVSQ